MNTTSNPAYAMLCCPRCRDHLDTRRLLAATVLYSCACGLLRIQGGALLPELNG